MCNHLSRISSLPALIWRNSPRECSFSEGLEIFNPSIHTETIKTGLHMEQLFTNKLSQLSDNKGGLQIGRICSTVKKCPHTRGSIGFGLLIISQFPETAI